MLVLFFYTAIRPIRSATRSELFHGRRKADGDFFQDLLPLRAAIQKEFLTDLQFDAVVLVYREQFAK